MNRFQNLFFKQIAQKISPYILLRKESIPPEGWVATLRKALGMSMKQLGSRIGKSAQAISEIQKREKEGSISLNSLREVASGMGMKLIYSIVPSDSDSLEEYIQKIAEKKALDIINRANMTMVLEEQQIAEERRKESISELTKEFLNEQKKLWD